MQIFAGPCVIESESHAVRVAEEIRAIGERLGVAITYKSSFDKANRSSGRSPRGPGLQQGLHILDLVKRETGLPLLTDIHEVAQADMAAAVADVVQIPAFLSRQTDLLQAAARTGREVLVKKGQFMAPGDMANVVAKVAEVLPSGIAVQDRLLLCERGTSFGYGDLVVDMRGLEIMRATGCRVVFDATHSVQQPGANGTSSGGVREMIPTLARAAAAVGIDALFVETHPDPANALSDPATVWPLDRLEELLEQVLAVHRAAQPKVAAESPRSAA